MCHECFAVNTFTQFELGQCTISGPAKDIKKLILLAQTDERLSKCSEAAMSQIPQSESIRNYRRNTEPNNSANWLDIRVLSGPGISW